MAACFSVLLPTCHVTKILNDSHCVKDEKLIGFAKKLVALQEEYVENLKRFL